MCPSAPYMHTGTHVVSSGSVARAGVAQTNKEPEVFRGALVNLCCGSAACSKESVLQGLPVPRESMY